jgi:2-polyprenyl-3-methyl-5-hydroxy-6-metoxy-1,4-benzoquinol methylase
MTPDETSLTRSERAGAWETEVVRGERFRFGENWSSFLKRLSQERIDAAEKSLTDMLELERLDGRTFLDIGSGSGLFSLAARRLGATVTSFDYDPRSIACTSELRRRYFPDDRGWTVLAGSVLDREFLNRLGRFDITYSWGVLHHTGAMWEALENVLPLVAPGGALFIALYNDQGRASRSWTRVKRLYVRSPRPIASLILAASLIRLWGPPIVRRLLGRRRAKPAHAPVPRGMDLWHDAKDWVGGYPFEVSTPEQIFDFHRERGFTLKRLKTCGGGLGCNEYVFVLAG